MDIRKEFARSGYLIMTSEFDTTNIVCRRGHIYADGDDLVAAIDGATAAESRALRRLGIVVMDGDFGELSVKFRVSKFRDVARIMKPRQVSLSLAA